MRGHLVGHQHLRDSEKDLVSQRIEVASIKALSDHSLEGETRSLVKSFTNSVDASQCGVWNPSQFHRVVGKD
jgi:hypothetical protein